MTPSFRISGKSLGELNHVAYCERCIWLKLRLQHRLPYQIFPGIFSSIDAYTKHIVAHDFDTGAAPAWMPGRGDIAGYLRPPGYQSFSAEDEETGIRLTGAADAILVRSDGSYVIADYKTARYTRGQDALRPTYEGQLNAYAWIAERTAWSPVSGLALIYMHPLTDQIHADNPENHRETGFALEFVAHVVPVSIDRDLVPKLLRRARVLYDRPEPPPSRTGCKDCRSVDRIAALLR